MLTTVSTRDISIAYIYIEDILTGCVRFENGVVEPCAYWQDFSLEPQLTYFGVTVVDHRASGGQLTGADAPGAGG